MDEANFSFESLLRRIVREELRAVPDGAEVHQGEQLLSAKTVAEQWDVPVSKIQDMARRGELPCVRLGHYVRFRPADLDQWVKDRSRGQSKDPSHLPTQLKAVRKKSTLSPK